MDAAALKAILDSKVDEFNRPDFILPDPVCIPHRFSLRQDIEISGFFAAILAWGQRKTIINKCLDLLDRMDNSPYEFIRQHTDNDLRRLTGYVHRTFNDTDLLYFVAFLKEHYRSFGSLEDAFLIGWEHRPFRNEYAGWDDLSGLTGQAPDVEESPEAGSSLVCFQGELARQSNKAGAFTIETALNNFRHYFISLPDYPQRTGKHISSPAQHSACKRLNMFLRWMVRRDERGVDFGIWNRLSPDLLVCPYDVHVDRVARALGLVTRRQRDWKTALELTDRLRSMDPRDPVKYDFALFGMGVLGVL